MFSLFQLSPQNFLIMKKSLMISMLFSLFFVMSAQAQEKIPTGPPVGPTTVLTFDTEEFEFGQISQGEKVQHIFRFTNTGDKPLVITNARGSCGCTVPEWPKAPIEPGGVGAIVVEFNSKGKIGMQSKTVTITANTDPPQTLLRLKGEIYKSDANYQDLAIGLKENTNPLDAVKNAKTANEMSIFPNPTKGELSLKIEEATDQSANIEIFDASGQLFRQMEVGDVGNGIIDLDASGFSNGQYWISVKLGEQERVSLPFVVAK